MRFCLCVLLVLAACGKGDKPPPPSSGGLLAQESGPGQPVPGPTKGPIRHDGPLDARTVFNNRCAMCHGREGRGDGISAGALTTKPRDYSDPKWQASVTDDAIRQIIVQGGKALGKSDSMQPNADLANQPAVLDGLVAIIRGFGKK
jgi:hypothetical protein